MTSKSETRIVPDRLIPSWAILYGVQTTVMERYSSSLPGGCELPRGSVKKLGQLRGKILDDIRGINRVIINQ